MKFKNWDKIEIIKNNGEKIEGIAPIIISASRSTDIPAFFSECFIDRLNAGYVRWTNPFNRVDQYVSFEKTRLIVFWTKNAEPLLKYLEKIDEKKIKYYFQFTLNDYEEEGFEPSVPKLEDRIETFKKLSTKISNERVIWRFDPLILTNEISVEKLLDKIQRIGNQIHNYTKKLVISFADIESYAKVKRNLLKAGIRYIEWESDKDNLEKFAKGIQRINEDWGLEIATCSESFNFDKYNIKHNKCIDDDLMKKIFSDDNRLMDFLGVNEGLSAFGGGSSIDLKDKGQRKQCSCIVSKDIGQYNTCKHLCIYCYANYSKDEVIKSFSKIPKDSDTIFCDKIK